MPLQVLVDNGEYMLQNKGDLAMIAVTIDRVLEHWPDARVGVLTFVPRMLPAYLPRAEPIAFSGGGHWAQADWFDQLARRVGPRWVSPTLGLRSGARALVREPASVVRRWRSARGAHGSGDIGAPEPGLSKEWVPAAVDQADLVVAAGGGYMADVDRVKAHWTLNMLERASDLGIPTAMFGQGFGPLEDPALTARARAVLPRVDLIAVREPLRGPALLARWGVPADRVLVTGDDAVELAHRAARPDFDNGIGLCLRATSYAPVGGEARNRLRAAIQASAHDLRARLVPQFISDYQSEDRRATMPLVAGYPDVARPLGRHASAEAFVARVATCRVVVTGAYHLAVFALSQGIPVVALSASRYSEDKMRGVGAQFGAGVTVVELESRDLEERLRGAVDAAWQAAPTVRPKLREAARAQIHASRDAFARVFGLVSEPAAAGRLGASLSGRDVPMRDRPA